MLRRDFLKKGTKIIAGSALAVGLTDMMKDKADAVTCTFVSQQTRYSSSCGAANHYNSCWFTTHCSDGTTRTYRAYCGYCVGNP